MPVGTSRESMYGAAAGCASICANDSPESSISHTLVTGSSAVLLVLVGVVLDDGAVDSTGVGEAAGSELARARLRCRR